MAYSLKDTVINYSEGSTWESAVKEWNIIGFEVDDSCSSKCVCGKESIKYLFTIGNMLNHTSLHPIGSRCIKKFGRNDLNDEVDVCEQMAKLLEAVNTNQFIAFNSDLFSRKLLSYLHDNGCFPPTQFNNNDPSRDYKFLLDMFNKRSEPSIRQKKKISALVMNAIIPFCKSKLST